MKVLTISDAFIDERSMLNGLAPLSKHVSEIVNVAWDVGTIEDLQKINSEIERAGSDSYLLPNYIINACLDADIIITHFCPINKTLIENAEKLKVIGVLRAGVENVNVAFASESNVVVVNTPGRNSDSVADFTVGMIISECRNIARGHHLLMQGKWDKNFSNSGNIPELRNKIVGLAGFGAIGQKVATRLRSFNTKILVYDDYVKEFPNWVKQCTLDELVENSDFLSIHLRYCESTKDIINLEMIKKMKSSAYIINTARSGIINEDDLITALANKIIAGAAIDVFDHEPLGDNSPFLQLDNITLTPHMAGGADDAFKNSPILICENLLNFWDNEQSPVNLVNHTVYENSIPTFEF